MGRNMLKLSTKGFEDFMKKFQDLGMDAESIFTDALNEAGEIITRDTLSAIAKPNLPAGGKYSTGRTATTVIKSPKAKLVGTTLEMNVGFDFAKKGAGGLLITGTPKMRRVEGLWTIYRGKRYMAEIRKGMTDKFETEVKKRLGG